MTRINDLSTVSGSTNTNSQFIWTIWNGKDYKVALADIGRYVGRNPGVCVTRQGGTTANIASGTIVPWANAFWDELGWWNSNSVGILQVKDDKFTHVDMRVQFSFLGNGAQRNIQLRVNGTAATSGTVYTSRLQTGGYPLQWSVQVNRYPVSSGDILDWYVIGGTAVNTMEANVLNHWHITPAEYK